MVVRSGCRGGGDEVVAAVGWRGCGGDRRWEMEMKRRLVVVGGDEAAIEDYTLPDGLKIPPPVGSYDGKGDPDNYLHLFKGAIRMQKWAMPVACHMFTYTLKDSTRIWWNGKKAGSIVNYEDLKAKFRSHFSQHKILQRPTWLYKISIKWEGESTRAFVIRKFLRTLPSKWRPKVTAIEESKDFSKLSLDELVGNLKVYEVVLEKYLESAKNKKEKYKSLALKER
ncbi:hypothetical protein Tco_0803619 [Tanacetum coccineum]|uniref:Retrotransposon gag domain-containing protein n=1 Tax=Tanacetum coccineum TaxID=301880 RepID=A0ABQ5A4W1_9ASTR